MEICEVNKSGCKNTSWRGPHWTVWRTAWMRVDVVQCLKNRERRLRSWILYLPYLQQSAWSVMGLASLRQTAGLIDQLIGAHMKNENCVDDLPHHPHIVRRILCLKDAAECEMPYSRFSERQIDVFVSISKCFIFQGEGKEKNPIKVVKGTLERQDFLPRLIVMALILKLPNLLHHQLLRLLRIRKQWQLWHDLSEIPSC